MRKINFKFEKDFENRKAAKENIRFKQSKFYWATSLLIDEHKKNTCKVIKDKDILEIGCSSGIDAMDYCKYVSSYTGVDISDVAISNCNKLNLKNAQFICTNGHKLPCQNKSFDFVIVNSLLHHLDLETVFKEIVRVLKNNGLLIFREPLGTNPIFYIYRKLTPDARTPDERPFTFSDLSLMKKYFYFNEVKYFGFFNIISAFLPNRIIRYALTSIDNFLAYTPIKYWYWQFCGFAKVKNK